jgi:polyhydroxyalkanoic acid synthase PhaR subunit
MKQQKYLDPFDMWKQFYDKAEEEWNHTIDQSMHKEEFSKWMGHYLNGYLQVQELTQKTASKYLEQANIPSRQDLVHVSSLVVNLEEKVDRLEQTVEEGFLHSKEMDSTRDIKSLKNDLAKMSKRLDQLFDLIENKKEASEQKVKTTI